MSGVNRLDGGAFERTAFNALANDAIFAGIVAASIVLASWVFNALRSRGRRDQRDAVLLR